MSPTLGSGTDGYDVRYGGRQLEHALIKQMSAHVGPPETNVAMGEEPLAA